MKGRIIFFTVGEQKSIKTYHKYFYDKTFYKIESMTMLIDKAKEIWKTNESLREEVREYFKEKYGDRVTKNTKVAIALGFQTSMPNPMRYTSSQKIMED